MNSSLNEDVRWKQRFNNYVSALYGLTDAVHASKQRKLSQLEQLGMIRRFVIAHELAWKVLKDYLQEQGVSHNLQDSIDSTRAAFRVGLIEDGESWMEMIKARYDAMHSYDEKIAQNIHDAICGKFYPALEQLKNRFNKLYEQSNE